MGTYETAFAPLARISHDIEGTSYQADVDYLARHRVISVVLQADTAGASYEYFIFKADKACTIVSAVFIPNVASAAHDDNHKTFALGTEDGAASTVLAMDSWSTDSNATPAGVSLAAGVPQAWTIDESTDVIAAGHVLRVGVTHAGAGVVVAGTVQVVVRYD